SGSTDRGATNSEAVLPAPRGLVQQAGRVPGAPMPATPRGRRSSRRKNRVVKGSSRSCLRRAAFGSKGKVKRGLVFLREREGVNPLQREQKAFVCREICVDSFVGQRAAVRPRDRAHEVFDFLIGHLAC